MAGPREASTAPSVRTPRSLSYRSTAVPGHESPSLSTSTATESAFSCYLWYAGRRRKALQIATGTSRTCSNATNERIVADRNGRVAHRPCDHLEGVTRGPSSTQNLLV